MNDGGSGLRFNFPAYSRFRTISWVEWLEHFDREHLMFLYEEVDTEYVAVRAYELWQAHGEQPGHDREDWFEAERDVRNAAGGASLSIRYRIVKLDTD